MEIPLHRNVGFATKVFFHWKIIQMKNFQPVLLTANSEDYLHVQIAWCVSNNIILGQAGDFSDSYS